MKHYLIKFYLDFVNDFLTLQTYADYNGIELKEAEELFKIGQKYHREKTES